MKDVAAACGVTVATVSKALNGHSDISEETRQLVSEKARELGYLANSAARALKTNRTYNIGVLFVDEGGRGLTHEFFAGVLDSFKAEAERNGYDITFINRNVVDKSTSYLQHCRYRGVDGVVIICVNFYDPEVQELVSSSLPVVTVDHSFNNITSVVSDNIVGLETLVRYAYGRGHRKIAYIHGEPTAVTENRLTGYHRACQELGIEVPEGYVKASNYYDADKGYEATSELLRLSDPPTCILFPDDFCLIGGIRAIYDAGLRIPDDISVMGYDGIVVSQVMTPKITTYRQNCEMLGKTAAAKLIDQINNPKTTVPERIVVQGNLVEGESVAVL